MGLPLLVIAVFSVATLTLVWLSSPDMFVGWLMLIVPLGWSLIGVFALVAVVTRSPRLHQPRVVWRVCLGTCLVSIGAGLMGVSEQIRIALSRDALVDAGQRVLAGERPTRAALYGLKHTSVSGGCALMTTGGLFIDSFGWAYCPDGAPEAFEPVGGSLYKFAFD